MGRTQSVGGELLSGAAVAERATVKIMGHQVSEEQSTLVCRGNTGFGSKQRQSWAAMKSPSRCCHSLGKDDVGLAFDPRETSSRGRRAG